MLHDDGLENIANDSTVPQVDVEIECIYVSNRADENHINVTDCIHFTDVIVSLQKSRKWSVLIIFQFYIAN